MKIAHISDLHLNTLFKDSNLLRVKRLLKYISSQSVEHLIITGDLTDNADESDLLILKRMLNKFGFSSHLNLTLIPGNHDIFGGPQKPVDIFSFPERCKEVDYDAKVNLFKEIFKETFYGTIVANEESQFPFIKDLDNVIILGINSIAEYSKYKNSFASNGEVKLKHFNKIDDLLKKFNDRDVFKIVAIHHHFNKMKNTKRSIAGLWQNIEKQTMKLKKKKRLLSLFQKHNIDIVLHGHIHYNEFYERKGIAFLNAGASTVGYTGKSLRVNIIKVEPDKTHCELHKLTESGEVKIEDLFRKEYQTILRLSPI
ncbi:metallophosphoesterase [Ignavibacterium sp.]|uniref:metallophosphoesterase family protein n=1 Tax=Ignavibacterium sp. TaxID=2651167 RepID=UPI002205DBF1|nr:metallophosphoesterase [Ignavibacterium sp.]BDQ01837.1 MAG: metallophosphoesterase [Ignavibacterium sp.]